MPIFRLATRRRRYSFVNPWAQTVSSSCVYVYFMASQHLIICVFVAHVRMAYGRQDQCCSLLGVTGYAGRSFGGCGLKDSEGMVSGKK